MAWLELGAENLSVSVSHTNSFTPMEKWSQHHPQFLFSIQNPLCATLSVFKTSQAEYLRLYMQEAVIHSLPNPS